MGIDGAKANSRMAVANKLAVLKSAPASKLDQETDIENPLWLFEFIQCLYHVHLGPFRSKNLPNSQCLDPFLAHLPQMSRLTCKITAKFPRHSPKMPSCPTMSIPRWKKPLPGVGTGGLESWDGLSMV